MVAREVMWVVGAKGNTLVDHKKGKKYKGYKDIRGNIKNQSRDGFVRVPTGTGFLAMSKLNQGFKSRCTAVILKFFNCPRPIFKIL